MYLSDSDNSNNSCDSFYGEGTYISYNKMSDEDFRNNKVIKNFIEYIKYYENFYVSALKDYLEDIYEALYKLYEPPITLFDDVFIESYKACFDQLFYYYSNKYTKTDDEFRCCLRFIEFIEKNKNDYGEYKTIKKLNDALLEMKNYMEKINTFVRDNDIRSKILLDINTKINKILNNHNMNLDQ